MFEKPECQVPSWIEQLVGEVAHCFDSSPGQMAHEVFGPIHPDEPEGSYNPWRVHVFPSLAEMAGGPEDGAQVNHGLTVDVIALQAIFDDIEYVYWTSRSVIRGSGIGGPNLEIAGWYCDHPVWLHCFESRPIGLPTEKGYEYLTCQFRFKE